MNHFIPESLCWLDTHLNLRSLSLSIPDDKRKHYSVPVHEVTRHLRHLLSPLPSCSLTSIIVASGFLGFTIMKAMLSTTAGARKKRPWRRTVGRIVSRDRIFSSSWYLSLKYESLFKLSHIYQFRDQLRFFSTEVAIVWFRQPQLPS